MMKKKMTGIMLTALLLVAAMVFPVSADRSFLDVSAGDRYSYYTYKLRDNDPYYYVSTETYVGYPVMACSAPKDGQASQFTIMEQGTGKRYSYGSIEAPYGQYCRLLAGPSYLSGNNWHLTGWYNP